MKYTLGEFGLQESKTKDNQDQEQVMYTERVTVWKGLLTVVQSFNSAIYFPYDFRQVNKHSVCQLLHV